MSDYKTQTGKTLDTSFSQFHQDNPHVYGKFVDYALAWIKTGAKKISSKQIIGRIRWFMEVETIGDEAKDYRINDGFTSRYSRKFIEDFPEYSELFNFRELRS